MEKNIANAELHELYQYGVKLLSPLKAKYTIEKKRDRIK